MKHARSLFSTALLSTVFIAASCGSDQPTDATATPGSEAPQTETTTTLGVLGMSEPPAIAVTQADKTIELDAWTFCWTPLGGGVGVCADGSPPQRDALQTLEGEGPILLSFAADFTFTVNAFDDAYETQIDGGAVIARVGDAWQIDPQVDLPIVIEIFGVGEQGDVITTLAIR